MKVVLIIAGVIVAAVLFCGLGAAIIGGQSPPASHTPDGYAATTLAPSSATSRHPAVAKGIRDGESLVGKDVTAGRYHSPGPADGLMCYWQLTTTANAQPGDSGFLKNDSPPGPSYVVLKTGQYFTTSHCGTWTLAP